MKDYFKRLKDHPRFGFAIIVTIMLFCAGAGNKSFSHWYEGGIFGLCVSIVFPWMTVLISNIKD